MSTPSILSAIQKLRALLTREEKLNWLGIVVFALTNSLLEIFTASVIVVFAQVLNAPETGLKYLGKIGFASDLSPGRVVFYIAMIVGGSLFYKKFDRRCGSVFSKFFNSKNELPF
ncbi:MAG: hypothetical protein ACR2HS_01235 [Gammaproteobacteria bacterium]